MEKSFVYQILKKIILLEKQTKKVARLLQKIRITTTQPDTQRIYHMMKEELQQDNQKL